MTGLVYKEWKQNRWFILSMILCGFTPLLVLLLLRGEIPNADNTALSIGGLIAGFFAAGALQMMVLRGDDRKLWGYWITSTSGGCKGFLRVKYEMVFGMVVLFMFSLQMFDKLICAVAFDVGTTEIGEISNVSVPLIFVQLLLRAIDTPFTLRYGNKKGSLIKLIYSLVFTIIISVMIVTNFCNFSVALFETGEKLFSGDNLSMIFGILSVSVIVIYYLSYRISCRIYLKGVEQYDH